VVDLINENDYQYRIEYFNEREKFTMANDPENDGLEAMSKGEVL